MWEAASEGILGTVAPGTNVYLALFLCKPHSFLQETGAQDTRHFRMAIALIYIPFSKLFTVFKPVHQISVQSTLFKVRRQLHACILLEGHCDDSYCHA